LSVFLFGTDLINPATALNSLVEKLQPGEVHAHELYDAMDWQQARRIRDEAHIRTATASLKSVVRRPNDRHRNRIRLAKRPKVSEAELSGSAEDEATMAGNSIGIKSSEM